MFVLSLTVLCTNITAKAQNEIREVKSETINDIKVKLKFHSEKNEMYEKEQKEIMIILGIESTNQPLVDILSAIKELKSYEETETVNYADAEAFLKSYMSKESFQ